jgi:hypothetical protein
MTVFLQLKSKGVKVLVMLRLLMISLLFILISLTARSQPSETIYPGTTIYTGYINDASYGPFNIGFNFTYFGNTYSQFYVSSNGLVLFGDGSISETNVSIPNSELPNNYIAGFWDDLAISYTGKILYTTIGAAPNRKLIIQFVNMDFYNIPSAFGTFLVILYETTNKIQVQYRLILDYTSTRAHGGTATIGLENAGGTAGVQYSYNNASAITNEQAISFTPSGPTYTVDPNSIYDGVYLTSNISLPDPGITVLKNPAQNAVIGSTQTLEWTEASNAASYTLYVSHRSDLTDGSIYYPGSNLSYNITGLTLDAEYYWGVFATNATGTTWCEIKRFTTSSAPPLAAVPQTVWTEQSKDKVIQLNYTGGNVSTKTAIITTLPAQGQLYQYNAGVRGLPISSLNTTVSDAGRRVIYAATGGTGNGVGSFNYLIHDSSGDSPPALVTVNVSPPGVPNVLYVAKDINIEIQFDVPMSDPANKEDQFSVLVNSSIAPINSVRLKEGDPYTYELILTTSLSGSETVLVSYTQGDITGETGGILFSFSEEPVILLTQNISFSQSLDRTYNESPFSLSASSNRGLGLTYSSSNFSVATITGSVSTFHSLGSSLITARQAGNAIYAPAKYLKTLTVSSGVQTITFASLPAKTTEDADFNPGATASSGLPLSYSSSNTSVATIISGMIHIVGAGTSVITASQAGNIYYNSATPVLQTLTVSNPAAKTLSLTSVMLQGLYNGSNSMRQANDENGPHWPAGIADHITVELHNSASYSLIVYSVSDVLLSTGGTATVTIPSAYSGSYYITIKHRNSIETTTTSAVSFAGTVISQSFGSPSNVFGGNLGISFDGRYLIYGGDVDQDGFVGASDMATVDNQSASFGMGYIVEDVDGDGFVGASDMAIIDNNSSNFIFTVTP